MINIPDDNSNLVTCYGIRLSIEAGISSINNNQKDLMKFISCLNKKMHINFDTHLFILF